MTNRSITTKTLALILTVVLILGGVVGGTVAWLIANPDPVVNTFTYGDINIDLEETDTNLDEDDDPNTNEYEMMPGQEIVKDPKITVKAGSESNWLFVKLEKSENFDDFMEYTVADGWMPLEGTENVYFRLVMEDDVKDADAAFEVIKDNKVTVREDVTKEMLNALDPEGEDANYPTLTVSAYAVQYVGFEPEITEGAEEPTDAQTQAAAFMAWSKVLESEAATEPTEP